jgi:hypothetical protein
LINQESQEIKTSSRVLLFLFFQDKSIIKTMKFFVAAIVCILASLSQTEAFTSPNLATSRFSTSLDITTLDEWQLLDNGSIVGSVRGHPTLRDGDIITTSPIARPDAARSNNMVATLTGSQYKLGRPMSVKGGAAPVEEPGFGRSTFVKTVGTTSLFAGGVALGIELGGLGKTDMTIPEVSSLEFGERLVHFL